MTFEERLAKVQAQFRQRIDRDGREILALAHAPALDAETVTRLRFLAHGLAGSAPMFDYARLGQAALEIEDAIRSAAIAERATTAEEIAQVREAAADFSACRDAALSG